MKTLLLASALLAFASSADAQYTAILGTDYPANSLNNLNQKPNMRTGTVAPTAACTAGLDLYVNTSNAKLYFCSTLNVWTEATAGGSVGSVFGRTGAVVAAIGDYTAAQVTNALDATQTYSDPGWLTALSATKLTSGFIPLARIGQNGATTGQALVWNGLAYAPATISGGGASNLYSLTDFNLTKTSSTVLTANSAATSSAPVLMRCGGTATQITAPGTVTLTAGTASATGYLYVDCSSGSPVLTFGHNTANTYTGSGVTIATGITGFPAATVSVPLWIATGTTGVWDTIAATNDRRSAFAAGKQLVAGLNVTLTETAGQVTIASSSGGSTVTANPPYITIGGQNYLPFGFAATIPPTVASGTWTGGNMTGATFTQAGNTVVLSTSGVANNFSVQHIAIGSTTTLTAVVGVGGMNSTFGNYPKCGIGIHRSTGVNTGPIAVISGIVNDYANGGGLNSDWWTTLSAGAGTAISSGVGNAPTANLPLRIVLSGGNIQMQYSLTGVYFSNAGAAVSSATVLGTTVTTTDRWAFVASGSGTGQIDCQLYSWSAI